MTPIEDCISNIKVEYHRNGVGGEGFYAIHFTFVDSTNPYCSGRLIAVVVPYEDGAKDKLKCDGRCYVVNPADPAQCYRGDMFESTMRRIMEAHSIDWHERLTGNHGRVFMDESVSHYNNFQSVREAVVKHGREK
jgi:hypothetical protein